jgi:general transcription factor 3C polypeptide 1
MSHAEYFNIQIWIIFPGWPEGWAIMCDLLLRLPLCIFVKVFNVSFIIPDLEQYLMHPVRRHYLVRHLPSRLRNTLIIARRYIFSIHEVMQRLCYVGLVQFGPQRLKEKDQVCFAEENSQQII